MPESRAMHFLKLATKNNLLTPEQAEQVLKGIEDRRALGVERSPAEIAVERGFLTTAQVATIESLLRTLFPPEQLGGFKIGEETGRGAVGTVYRGKQISLDKAVAIKILHSSLTAHPRYVQRFIQEARAAARLNHPNIVQAIDAGVEQEYNYFVMEFVDGETLGTLLRRAGRLAEKKALDIALAVAHGLEHAHQNGLLHRDLKPDNILIGKNGQIKIADLGLAIPLEDADLLMEEHKRMGTPFYLSPEQAQGKEIEPRSDLYALGATMYHMLAGRPPFTGNTVKEILTKQVHQEPIALSEIQDDISPAVEAIVLNLLAKDPAARYESPSALISALNEARLAPKAAPQKSAPPKPGALKRRGESPAHTVAREKGSAAASTVTVAQTRAARASGQPAASPSAAKESAEKPAATAKRRGPGVFTISGGVLGILISLIFFMLAVSRGQEKPKLQEENKKAMLASRVESDKEVVAKRHVQWVEDKITKPAKEIGSALSTSKKADADATRMLSLLWDALKNKPDAPNSLEIIEQTIVLRKRIKDAEKTEADVNIFSKAEQLWAAGEYKDAYRMLEHTTDWPLELRTDESKARAVALLNTWDEYINKRYAEEMASVQKLRTAKDYAKAIEILNGIPSYADYLKITNSEKTLLDVEAERDAFVKQEHERIAKQNEIDYKAFLAECMALCQIRDFNTCIEKAKKMESTFENEMVKKDLRQDIAALTVAQGFMDSFVGILERAKGSNKEFTFKLTNDNKQTGSVEKLERDRVFLSMKRGTGVASVPIEYSKIIDDSIFKVVASEVGEKTERYMVPIALINAYRGNFDVARAILTVATTNGIDVSRWTEKLNALQAAKGG